MKDFIKKHKYGIIAVIISMIAAVLYCLAKRDFNVDESLSFAQSNVLNGWINYDMQGWHERSTWSGYEVQKRFSYLNIYRNLYWENHLPLYHYLLHTIMSFFLGRFTIWFGLIINLGFFFLDLIFLYLILNKLTSSDLYSGLGVLLFSLNKQTLNQVTNIRMYVASSFFVILFLYGAIKVFKKDGNKYINLSILFLSVIGGGLTHYQFYMIIASISLFVAIYLIVKKRWFDLISSFIVIVGAGLLNVFVIFRATLFHLQPDSPAGAGHIAVAENALKSLGVSVDKLVTFINFSWGGAIEFTITILLLVLLIVLTIKKKEEKYSLNIVLLASYLLAFYIITKTSTYESERYLFHLEAVGIIGNFVSIYELLKNKINEKILLIVFMVMIGLNININPLKNLGTTKSWDYAKEHQDDLAYIINSEYTVEPFQVNVLFTNLRWYISTGITYLDEELGFGDDRNLTVYIDRNLDEDEALDYLKNQYEGSKELIITKQDIPECNYTIYSVTFGD